MIRTKKGNFYVEGDKLISIQTLPESQRRGFFAGDHYSATVEEDGKRFAAKLPRHYQENRGTVVAFAEASGLTRRWAQPTQAQLWYIHPDYQFRF